jgi:hypothetical protein
MTDERIDIGKRPRVTWLGFTKYRGPNKGSGPRRLRRIAPILRFAILVVADLYSSRLPAQTEATTMPASTATPANSWDFNVSINGYLVPRGQSYFSPTFIGDHDTLRVEARYNYETQQTGSLWVG